MTDDMTVAEIEDEIGDEDDVERLEAMLAAEQDGKDRVTAKDALKERILEAEDDKMDGDTTSDTADEETRPDDYVRVKPRDGAGHIAGYSFANSEVKHVPADAKVQKALARGRLQLVR